MALTRQSQGTGTGPTNEVKDGSWEFSFEEFQRNDMGRLQTARISSRSFMYQDGGLSGMFTETVTPRDFSCFFTTNEELRERVRR